MEQVRHRQPAVLVGVLDFGQTGDGLGQQALRLGRVQDHHGLLDLGRVYHVIFHWIEHALPPPCSSFDYSAPARARDLYPAATTKNTVRVAPRQHTSVNSSSSAAGVFTTPPKNSVAHLGVLEQLFGRRLHEYPPALHDDALGGDTEAEADVLLDQDRRSCPFGSWSGWPL